MDLSAVEQLIDDGQALAIAHLLKRCAEQLVEEIADMEALRTGLHKERRLAMPPSDQDGGSENGPEARLRAWLDTMLDKGFDAVTGTPEGNLAEPRLLELMAAFNRLRRPPVTERGA